MSVKFWPTVDFCSLAKGGKNAPNLRLTLLLFWLWKFSLVFTNCIVISHWVPGHPTHLPCTEQYSVHCTVHCVLYCTINCNQTSKWLAELTYIKRNNHFSIQYTVQGVQWVSYRVCSVYLISKPSRDLTEKNTQLDIISPTGYFKSPIGDISTNWGLESFSLTLLYLTKKIPNPQLCILSPTG